MHPWKRRRQLLAARMLALEKPPRQMLQRLMMLQLPPLPRHANEALVSRPERSQRRQKSRHMTSLVTLSQSVAMPAQQPAWRRMTQSMTM